MPTKPSLHKVSACQLCQLDRRRHLADEREVGRRGRMASLHCQPHRICRQTLATPRATRSRHRLLIIASVRTVTTHYSSCSSHLRLELRHHATCLSSSSLRPATILAHQRHPTSVSLSRCPTAGNGILEPELAAFSTALIETSHRHRLRRRRGAGARLGRVESRHRLRVRAWWTREARPDRRIATVVDRGAIQSREAISARATATLGTVGETKTCEIGVKGKRRTSRSRKKRTLRWLEGLVFLVSAFVSPANSQTRFTDPNRFLKAQHYPLRLSPVSYMTQTFEANCCDTLRQARDGPLGR